MIKRRSPFVWSEGGPFDGPRRASGPFDGPRPVSGGRDGGGPGLSAALRRLVDAALSMPMPTGGSVGQTIDTVRPLADFARDPNLVSGLLAAVVVPTGGRASLVQRAALARRLLSGGTEPTRIGGGEMGVNRILGAARQRGMVATPKAGARPDAEADRYTFLISPKGEIVFGPPGYHHAQTAQAAGIPRIQGYTQGELFRPNAEFDIPARLFTTSLGGNAQGARFTRRQAAALASFLQGAKGVQVITPDQVARFNR